MSIQPENWLEWEWHVVHANAVGVVIADQTARLWRVTVTVELTGTATQVQFVKLPFALENIVVPPGSTVTVEPLGMQPATVDILSGDGQVICEYIKKSPPII